jgi:hypothetical protein
MIGETRWRRERKKESEKERKQARKKLQRRIFFGMRTSKSKVD